VGEVLVSAADGFAVGDLVLHDRGWRDHTVLKARFATRVEADEVPLTAFLGVLGMPGFTAYVGLLDVGRLRDGDVVFVSGAAGAVGSLAGQIAKLRGHTVIGSAGSADKVAHLVDDLGFDAAFDYHDGPVADQLAAVAADGIDLYFDNVGGDHLEGAIAAMRPYGRIAACGAVAVYNDLEPAPGPRNLFQIVGKRLSINGFIVSDHEDRRADFLADVGGWLRESRIAFRETVVEGGIEAAPQAFIDLLRGVNTGKMLIRI
jgi:NADPH-dependent curcumin reductase CurA